MGILQSISILTMFMQTPVEVDLLVFGGGENAYAAAAQAARLKVSRIAIVDDIDWWGDWTLYRNRRVHLPRQGNVLEVMHTIREYNG